MGGALFSIYKHIDEFCWKLFLQRCFIQMQVTFIPYFIILKKKKKTPPENQRSNLQLDHEKDSRRSPPFTRKTLVTIYHLWGVDVHLLSINLPFYHSVVFILGSSFSLSYGQSQGSLLLSFGPTAHWCIKFICPHSLWAIHSTENPF